MDVDHSIGMKKIIYTALASVLLAALFSFLYFYFNREQMAVIGYALYGVIYVIFQFIVGFVVTDKDIGMGLKLGAGIILLVGFTVCTSGAV